MSRLNLEVPAACDLLVVGSGAAGLSAAIAARHHGLEVVVLEKAAQFGGTTALSGGAVWIPCNSFAQRDGIPDSLDAARRYLEAEAGAYFDAEHVDSYLATGPRMVEFFDRYSAVKFVPDHSFPDYHPDLPGGLPGGRSLWAAPYDARALGDAFALLAPPLPQYTFLGMGIGSGVDYRHFMNAQRSLRSAFYVARRVIEHGLHKLRYGHGIRLFNGNALVARLARTVLDLGIPLQLSSPIQSLVVEGGAVRGALFRTEDGTRSIVARRGVLLACGGFPSDAALRATYLSPSQIHSLAPAENNGDGLRLAEAAGGAIVTAVKTPTYSAPVSHIPRPGGTEWLMPHFVDRGKPGIIAVTATGRRFVNESNSYQDVAHALIREQVDGRRNSAFFLCDHRAIRQYGLGYAKPFPVPLGPHIRSGYLLRGDTIAALARTCGIDAAALQATIERFNADARKGVDSEFGKGSSAYNRFQGDAAHRPNPGLAPIDTPPFYAVKIEAADMGTFIGLRTNGHAQVLGDDGNPIAGLYAAGNDAASIFGGSCPGGGVTIGPAMTFGYIAGCHAAGAQP